MKLLHIDSSVLGPHSVSRQVSAAIVDRLRKATPGLEIVYRDLTSTPLAHLSGSASRRRARRRARSRLAAGPRRRPGGAGGISCRRHRGARRADVQFHDPEPAQGLDRPHRGSRQDLQIRRARRRRIGRQQARHHRRSRAADSTAPARRPRWASTSKPICAGCSASSASPTPKSFPPTASRPEPEHREKAVAGALQAATRSSRGVRKRRG